MRRRADKVDAPAPSLSPTARAAPRRVFRRPWSSVLSLLLTHALALLEGRGGARLAPPPGSAGRPGSQALARAPGGAVWG